VYPRSALRLALRLTEHLTRAGRRVAFAESEEAPQIRDGMAFRPAEILKVEKSSTLVEHITCHQGEACVEE
jgi:hypothetical protein